MKPAVWFGLFQSARSLIRNLIPSTFIVAASAFMTMAAYGADAVSAKTSPVKEELVEIMKGMSFEPRFGKDNPFCETFYEDFKAQANIEHVQPVVVAETYEDSELRGYRDKCPKLDLRKTMAFSHRDIEAVGEPTDQGDAEARAVSISIGQRNYQLFNVDIDNNPKNGKEYVLYYEGVVDLKSLVHGATTPKRYPSNRVYRTIDFSQCKADVINYFNQDASETWTRNGIIRHNGKTGIYVLQSTKGERPNYRFLELWMYSEKLQRVAPTCAYAPPRKRN